MNPIQFATLLMAGLVGASNYLVRFPLNDWVTWGAFTYPFTFLVTEVVNRFYGTQKARQVVYVGFIAALIFSFILVDVRIAFASSSAFLISQLLDISIFNRFRQAKWWYAPAIASVLSTSLDTFVFFSIAFVGTDVPWVTLGAGDSLIKLSMDLLLLLPFRVLVISMPSLRSQSSI